MCTVPMQLDKNIFGRIKFCELHSKEALHHAKMASEEHHDRHMHMEKAVTKLNEAIVHANKQHSELASRAAHKAVERIHQWFN